MLPCSAGELSAEELESIMTIVANPRAYKIPDWFLNRQKDVKDGRYSQARQRWGCGAGPAGLPVGWSAARSLLPLCVHAGQSYGPGASSETAAGTLEPGLHGQSYAGS